MLELVRLNPFGCESRKTALGAVPGALPNAPFVLDRKPPFERAWGWDSLLPVNLVTSLSIYKIYLRQYYIRNHQREGNAAGADDLSLDGDDHGNGLLAALVDKCIKTEDILKLQWKCRAKSFTIDDDVKEVSLVSHKITKHTCEMAQVSGSEFPAAAIAPGIVPCLLCWSCVMNVLLLQSLLCMT